MLKASEPVAFAPRAASLSNSAWSIWPASRRAARSRVTFMEWPENSCASGRLVGSRDRRVQGDAGGGTMRSLRSVPQAFESGSGLETIVDRRTDRAATGIARDVRSHLVVHIADAQ